VHAASENTVIVCQKGPAGSCVHVSVPLLMLPAKPEEQMQVKVLVGPKTFQPAKALAGHFGCSTVLQPVSACVVALKTGAEPTPHAHGIHVYLAESQLANAPGGHEGCATELQPISACVVELKTGAEPKPHAHGSHTLATKSQLVPAPSTHVGCLTRLQAVSVCVPFTVEKTDAAPHMHWHWDHVMVDAVKKGGFVLATQVGAGPEKTQPVTPLMSYPAAA
jgi:hypothetical protein